jgi:hypothetical protein
MMGGAQSQPLPVVAAPSGRPTLDWRAVADYAGRHHDDMHSLVVIEGAMLLVGGPSLDRGRGTGSSRPLSA